MMKNKNNIIIIGSVVAIGVLAILFLRTPKENPQVRLKKLKKDSDEKLLSLQMERSLATNFDDIVKIDAEIDTIKNRLKSAGLNDIITEMKMSDDLTQALKK